MNVEQLKRLQKLRGVDKPGAAPPVISGLKPGLNPLLDAQAPVRYTPPGAQPSKPPNQYALPRDRK
jgi:hypothetical protein